MKDLAGVGWEVRWGMKIGDCPHFEFIILVAMWSHTAIWCCVLSKTVFVDIEILKTVQ